MKTQPNQSCCASFNTELPSNRHEFPLIRPADTFSPTGGEGWVEGAIRSNLNALWHNAVLLLVLCLAWTASAATLTVTNSADAGPGSLRQAIADAAAGDTIAFDASLTNQTITLTNGQLTVDKSLVIDAADLKITIDGNGTVTTNRIFEFASGTTNQLAGLTLTHGRVDGYNSGGAILVDSGATLTITNSTLANNSASYGVGGGIYNDGTLTIMNPRWPTTRPANFGNGGGIDNDGTLTIINSTLANNAADWGGGGIDNDGGTLTIINSTLANNNAAGYRRRDLQLRRHADRQNSTLANNSAANARNLQRRDLNYGGTLTIINSTLANNSADAYSGGGIYNYGTLSLTNTIVAQNSAIHGPNIYGIGSNTTISHCLTNGVPQLAPLGNYGGPTQTMPPLPGSPAIDAGDDSVTNFLATDQRGFPRVSTARWTSARRNSEGIHRSSPRMTPANAAPCAMPLHSRRRAYHHLRASLAANDHPHPGQIMVNKSLIIDAADRKITIDGNGTVTGNRIFEFASGTTNRLAGLTLTDGRAKGNGGAILLDSGATLTITNSTLANNAATERYDSGGGIYNDGTLTLQNATLANNEAGYFGGGIYNSGTLRIINSTLANNEADFGGGAIENGSGSTLTITNSTLANNWAGRYGGGIENRNGTLTILNSTLTYNAAGYGGGINNSGTLTIQNATLANNSAGTTGGGIINNLDSTLTIINSTLANNWAGRGGGIENYGTLTLTNTIVAQNSSPNGPNIYGGYNITIFHCLTNGVAGLAPLGNYGGPTQTMPLLPGSPAIDAGDDSVTNFLATDQRGFPRVAGSAVDIGACEFVPPTPATLYVWQDSPNPTPPFATWATAAKNIQDAVNAAQAGDTVLVTNGVYASGGTYYSRVEVGQAITVRSVNGPGVTVIDGLHSVRCASLGNNAVMSGFTLTNGMTSSAGGGVLCDDSAILTNCTIIGNSARGPGGGVRYGTCYNCTIADNSSEDSGGGVLEGTCYNCTITCNSAAASGGGAYKGMLYNCVVSGNSANLWGGGANGNVLLNCTVTHNSAHWGGGTFGCYLTNCIIFFNSAAFGANYGANDPVQLTLDHCCTTPLPANGIGNIDLDPRLASASHLSAVSPCIGAGRADAIIGTDIDGDHWASPPSMGCDEYVAGAVDGPLSVAISASFTNVSTGFPVDFTAHISGRTTANLWYLGQGQVVNDEVYTSRSWSEPGTYPVLLRAYNQSHPDGVTATAWVQVTAPSIHYVDDAGVNPTPPYDSWSTAATTIQDAVDAAKPGDLVLVTNGVYTTGERPVKTTLATRLVVDKPIRVVSVNGPDATVIQGASGVRCVYLGADSCLSGFTLRDGHTHSGSQIEDESGGGAWCERSAVLTNCVITGCSAITSGGGARNGSFYDCRITGNSAYNNGAGVVFGWLYNCTVTENSAGGNGGGVFRGILNNCTVAGNTASYGGGANDSTLTNCIVYFNQASSGPNHQTCTLDYCCTTPLPTSSGQHL